MGYPWHFYFMAAFYITAGILHFIKPRAYMRIMPRYLPWHRLLVYLSGAAEIILGTALFLPLFKELAIYGLLLMLVIFIPVHLYMLSEKKASLRIPRWLLVFRIPIQFGLMYWAWWYL